jgi:hypothetical protein
MDNGLNMDFMSYSNYHLVDKDPSALLDPDVLLRHSEKTFQTFFKHFAATGRYTYSGDGKMAVYDDVQSLDKSVCAQARAPPPNIATCQINLPSTTTTTTMPRRFGSEITGNRGKKQERLSKARSSIILK